MINFEKYTAALDDSEKQWCNAIFRHLYGNQDIRFKNQDLALASFFNSKSLKTSDIDKLPNEPRIRKIVNFIRNEIIPINAGKVVRCEDLKYLPESYKTGCFWLDATSQGYSSTTEEKKIDEHIETLKGRRNALNLLIESAELVQKACKRLEDESA